MDIFLDVVSSFPVAIYSTLLIVVAIYWLIACLGLVDIKTFDADVDVSGGLDLGDGFDIGADVGLDGGPDLDFDVGAGGAEGADLDLDAGAPDADGALESGVGGLAGLLLKLGLHGVPVTIVISLVTILGWLISYQGYYHFTGRFDSAMMRYLTGAALFIASLGLAVFVTSLLLRPVRKLIRGGQPAITTRTLLGRAVTVRSGTLGHDSEGQVLFEEEGHSMILRARTRGQGHVFSHGDRVFLMRHNPDNTYIVISEDEFKGRRS